MLLSLVVSTIAFFAASYFIKRRFDEMDLPRGMTRNVTIFVLALAIAYGVAGLVGMIAGD
jgi:phosphoglycerol transferase MdoB-like AlkP superfamily enzyme